MNADQILGWRNDPVGNDGMTAEERLAAILEIVRSNAREGIDQGRVEDYRDNMHDTLNEMFPEITPSEARAAEVEFDRIVKG